MLSRPRPRRRPNHVDGPCGSGPPRPSCYQGHFLPRKTLWARACCATRCFSGLAGLSGRSPGLVLLAMRRGRRAVLGGHYLAQVPHRRRDLEAGSRGLGLVMELQVMPKVLSVAPAAVEVGAPTQQRRPDAPLTASRCPRRWPSFHYHPVQNVVAHLQRRLRASHTAHPYFSRSRWPPLLYRLGAVLSPTREARHWP